MRELENRLIYGEMPKGMEAVIANALEREAYPMKKRRFAVAVVAAVLMVALACTALALTLGKNARYEVAKTAREAVMEKYGISKEAMGMLYEQKRERDDGSWQVIFEGVKFSLNAIGTYTVDIKEGEEPVVTWTHDGVDLDELAERGLDSPIWGRAQLEQALSVDREYYAWMQQNPGEENESFMETAAKRDKLLIDAGIDAWVVHMSPGPDDVQAEEAVAIAREALAKTYGLPAEKVAQFESDMMFLKYQDEEEPVYRIWFAWGAPDTEQYEWGEVWVYSPSRKASHCVWVVEPERRTLPEGDLTGYEEAVKMFVEEGAFDILPPPEKASIGSRITEAGYGQYIDYLNYEVPGSADLSQDKALALAKEAMEKTYGITEEMTFPFDISASFLRVKETPAWVVTYKPLDEPRLKAWDALITKLGEYRVVLEREPGSLAEITWSMDEYAKEAAAFAEPGWAMAPAYDAKMLPKLQALLEATQAYNEYYEQALSDVEAYENGEIPDWSLEDASAYAQLYRDAGFSKDQYPTTLPKEGDITKEQALEYARQALRDELGLSEERIKETVYRVAFLERESEPAVWSFTYFATTPGYQDSYYVEINAATGEVAYIEYVATGNG